MKRQLLTIIALLIISFSASAHFEETLTADSLSKNLRDDFGLVDDGAKSDQSVLVQNAINQISKHGGGKLYIPKGVYNFHKIYLKSNVHLFIERDTVIKPIWPKNSGSVVFNMGTPKGEDGHIENVSVRGDGGKFIIDYSYRGRLINDSIRAFTCREVKNFLISDILIKDSYTTYCAISFGINKATAGKVDVFRPTHGLVQNLECWDCSPGYGLLQMHAGDTIHFENLSVIRGGVTFRLETGAGGLHGGVHDITANNLYCEDGSSAALLGPHKAQNGVVIIDGVLVKGCAWAVTMGPGYVEERNKEIVEYKPGIFGEGTTVRNVHAVFGNNAAISLKNLGNVPEPYIKQLRFDPNDLVLKRVRGPSVGVIRDSTGDSWNCIIENVTSDGFEFNKGIVKLDKKASRTVGYKTLLKGTPLLEKLENTVSLKVLAQQAREAAEASTK